MSLKPNVQCKQSTWKNFKQQLGELQYGRGNKRNVLIRSNEKQLSIQPCSADSQHRDEQQQPLVASFLIENADSDHTNIFTCSSRLVCVWVGALYPADTLLALRLCLGHRPQAPVIPKTDNDSLSLGCWPSSFQCLITLGNISFECTGSEFSVKSEFALSE